MTKEPKIFPEVGDVTRMFSSKDKDYWKEHLVVRREKFGEEFRLGFADGGSLSHWNGAWRIEIGPAEQIIEIRIIRKS